MLIYAAPLLGQAKTCEVLFTEGVSSSKIKVSIFDNVIYIPISVNDNSPIDFVLDTGAPEITTIEKGIITRMNIKTNKGGYLRGAGAKSLEFVWLEGVKLTLPNIKVLGARMAAHSLVHMEPYWGKPKYGLLGGNILKHVVTEIDYIKSYVRFYQPDKYIYKGNGQKIPIKFISNAVLVKARVCINAGEEDFEGLFLIDTGVRNTFFNSPFVRKHCILEKTKKTVENITGFGIGGEGFGKLSRIKTIQMGSYKIDNAIIELTTDTTGVAASKQFDGIIGADLLSRFKVIFDYKRGEMILEPNENFHDFYNYDMSGLYLIVNDMDKELYKVAYVVKDSPAEFAGIEKGDALVRVNGNPVKSYNYEQIKNVFKQVGETVTLDILRDTILKKFSIKLKKLL
jgi:membrane-associated protease RseP (regulator of RpoE activity)